MLPLLFANKGDVDVVAVAMVTCCGCRIMDGLRLPEMVLIDVMLWFPFWLITGAPAVEMTFKKELIGLVDTFGAC